MKTKISTKTINGIKSGQFYTEQKGSGATWFTVAKKNDNGQYQETYKIFIQENEVSVKLLGSGYTEQVFSSKKEARNFYNGLKPVTRISAKEFKNLVRWIKMDPKLLDRQFKKIKVTQDRPVKVIIECTEYRILTSMNKKLIEYNVNGEYEAYNALLDYIEENYTPIGHQSNVYYRR